MSIGKIDRASSVSAWVFLMRPSKARSREKSGSSRRTEEGAPGYQMIIAFFRLVALYIPLLKKGERLDTSRYETQQTRHKMSKSVCLI